jgi:transcriptional regulator with XRE-family HTH domain
VAELASRLDLDESRIQRWMSGQEPVAPATQLALLSDLQLPVEDLDSLFTHRPPPDPSKPQGTLWATGLRGAVRAHSGYRTLGRLAAELEIPAQGLYDKAELLEPVPTDLRDRILLALGSVATGGESAVTNRAPDWSAFRWAPGLRDLLGERGMSAEELASALDVDLERVLDWVAMDNRPVATLWAQDKVKRGQLSRETQDALVRALGGAVDRNRLFAAERSEAGSQWAVKPLFALAVNQYDGGLAGFAGDVDAAPEQVERWIAQTEAVPASAQARILKVLGLGPEDAAQLFLPEKRELEDVG